MGWLADAASYTRLMTTTVNHTNQIPSSAGPRMAVFLTAGATWTDMPAALTEFNGATSARQRVDLRAFNFARLSANVGATAGAASALLQVQYSLDDGSTWAYLDGLLTTSGGPQAPVGSTNSGTAKTNQGPWVALASAAKQDGVLIRLVGLTGDGVVDPVLGAAVVTFSA